jgi:hypothetical protein
LFCGLLAISLVSCRNGGEKTTSSATPPPPQKGPAALQTRAEQYWQARTDKDWKELYAFLEPWQKSSGTPTDYEAWAKENEPFNVLSFRIVKADQEGPYGWVRVNYESTLRIYPDAPPRQTEVDQKWQAETGEWFPVPAQNADGYPLPPALRDHAAEARLRQRFDESWKARRAKDWSGLYALVDPEDHEAVSPAEYAESEGLFDYISCDVKWVEAVADHGKVRVAYHHKVTDPNLTKLPAREAELTEFWVKVNNEWYRDLKRRG